MSGLAHLVASLGGIGRLRPAPGTWGSAAVLPLALGGPWVCLAGAAVLVLAGLWALSRLEDAGADPPWVVVDEGAGQLVALTAVGGDGFLAQVVFAFVAFRVLDVAKPGPVGWADRTPGGWGVMLDDLIAGALAAVLLFALRAAGLPSGV
jgi:phosphatidylglycerophosphatase A